MRREIKPEMLDSLPADDPRAIQSRRDLQKVNWWMGNAGMMSGLLNGLLRQDRPQSLVELGAGDGTLLLRLAARLAPKWKPARILLLDRQLLVSARTRAKFEELGWPVEVVRLDVFDWLERRNPEPHDVFLANLFLHHFDDHALRRLLGHVAQQAGVFMACEPRRAELTLFATGLLPLLACNSVSVDDGRISVRAGFAGNELSTLWPSGEESWQLLERPAGLFSHCFVAQRTNSYRSKA